MIDMSEFWTTAWNQNCMTIIMLTDSSEAKTNYFCVKKSGTQKYKQNVIVEDVDAKPFENKQYTVTSVKLKKSEILRDVTLIRFTDWPATGNPENKEQFVEFYTLVNDNRTSHDVPVWVHCSGGVNRCAAYIAFDMLKKKYTAVTLTENEICACLEILKKNKLETYEELSNDINQLYTTFKTPTNDLKLTKPVKKKGTYTGVPVIDYEQPAPILSEHTMYYD